MKDYKRLELINRRSAVVARSMGNSKMSAAYTNLANYNLQLHDKQQAELKASGVVIAPKPTMS